MRRSSELVDEVVVIFFLGLRLWPRGALGVQHGDQVLALRRAQPRYVENERREFVGLVWSDMDHSFRRRKALDVGLPAPVGQRNRSLGVILVLRHEWVKSQPRSPDRSKAHLSPELLLLLHLIASRVHAPRPRGCPPRPPTSVPRAS